MKNTKKKGFTIVELVIVIAVIGILSAILIPTFANLVNKAQETALQANLTNAYHEYASVYADKEGFLAQDEVAFVVADGKDDDGTYAYYDGKYYKVEGNQITLDNKSTKTVTEENVKETDSSTITNTEENSNGKFNGYEAKRVTVE